MPLIDRLGGDLPRGPVTVELDDIQATVLRYRPEPYYGTHVMLHVEDAQAGREFVRRLTPHVDSAAEWWQAGEAWTSVAISYTGLVALGLPEDSLQSFPEAFRVGMAARADKLRDYGPNDPKNWEQPFGTGEIHIAVSVFSDSEDDVAPRHGDGAAAVSGVLRRHRADDAGLRRPAGRPQPAGLQGFASVSPPSRAAASSRCPARDDRSRPANSSSAIPARPACRCRCPAPDVLGRNGTFVGLRKYQSRVGTFNRFLREHAADRAGAGAARGEAGGPLAQRRALDARARRRTTRRSAQTRAGTTTSPTPPIRTAGRCRSARTCGA